MAKLKDLILEINNQVNSNELSALAGASGLQEIDVEDDTLKEVKTKLSGLMSLDAAKNNPELETAFKKKLYGTIKGELLGNIDTDLLNSAKELFGDDAPDKFKDIEFTSDKVKKFAELTKGLIASKSTDEGLKSVNEGLKKQIDDLSKGFQKDLTKKEKEIKALNQGFTDRLIQKEFTGQLANYNLGDKYQDDFIKKALYNEVLSKVQKKAKLTLNEEGFIVPKNPENPELELFINNKKVEDLKELLDSEMQPYIKKSGTPLAQKHEFKKQDLVSGISKMATDRMRRNA